MMRRAAWSTTVSGRVNPIIPVVVALAGLILLGLGWRWIGAGVAIGAVLAFVNGLLLSGRIDMAAAMGDVGRGLLVMQVGLLATLTIIGIVTFILIKISMSMAIASAVGFAITQLALLAAFYMTQARNATVTAERKV